MLFFMLFMALLIAFLLMTGHRSRVALAMVMLLAAFLLLFVAVILYFAKDGSYHELVTRYFYLPDEAWRYLFYLRVDRLWLIRLLNLSNLAVVFCSCRFAYLFYREQRTDTRLFAAMKAVVCYVLLCAVLFDPAFQIAAYYFLYPRFMLPAQFAGLTNAMENTVHTVDLLLCGAGVCMILLAMKEMPHIHTILLNSIVLVVSYILLCGCYALFFSFAPAYFLKISKFSGSYRILSINTTANLESYLFLPYFLVLTFCCICAATLRLSHISNRIQANDFALSRQISASETTSKVFCHYIKNELLAIQSQIDLIPENEENRDTVEKLKGRCENLYTRMDAIHRSTKTSELQLVENDLRTVVAETLKPFEGELKAYSVKVSEPSDPVRVLADGEYLQQALHNLVRNALDAMEDLPPERKTLVLRLSVIDRWAVLEVEDTGHGIPESNLQQIFTPFFSSQPFSRHWGIGLSLTYKIVKAHEGKMEVESTYGKGTDMKVVLPCLERGRR